MSMKKSIILFTVLFLCTITSQAYSSNICEEAHKGLTETHVIFNEYFNSYIYHHNAAGHAIIRDVYPTETGNEYFLKLDCGNDVILLTKSNSGFLRELKLNQKVDFSGEVQSWKKVFYQNSDKSYIEITLGNSSIRW